MDTWIPDMIRAVSRRRVAVWCLALVCGLLLATSNHRYVINFLRGPFELGGAQLDSIGDVTTTPRYFARVSGSKVFDTGIRQYAVHTTNGVETSRSESGAYYVLVIGDRFLLFKTAAEPSGVAEGELAPLPAGLQDQLVDSKEIRALRSRFYPFYVNNESFRLPGYVLLGLALVFLFFFVRKAVPVWRYVQEPADHPLLKRVAKWGGDPRGVVVGVERDFRNPRHKGGDGWKLGDQYLVQSTFFKFNVLRLEDLLWAYKKVTRHSVNLIPTGKTYQAILACYGGSAVIPGREKRVDEILAFAQARVPWAVLGYSPELAMLFRTKGSEFASAVEARRREWEHKGGQQGNA
ncbi:MAG TPA: DUF6709 family protein [Gemmatimonadales bacterium]|nr:DUF6709 family protein [Gemmatimonadales bacterium]